MFASINPLNLLSTSQGPHETEQHTQHSSLTILSTSDQLRRLRNHDEILIPGPTIQGESRGGRNMTQTRPRERVIAREGVVELDKDNAWSTHAHGHGTEQQLKVVTSLGDERRAMWNATNRERDLIEERDLLLARYVALEKNAKLLEEENRQLFKSNQHFQNEFHRYGAEYNQMRQLLNERTAELKSAQVFLSKADILSGGEVIKIVESLNSEILQTAAYMADSLSRPSVKAKVESEAVQLRKEAGKRLRSTLGSKLLSLLARQASHPADDGDSILVQTALQVCLLSWCADTVESWCYWGQRSGTFLAEVYSKIQEAEDQTVSGRWRAITRAQIRGLSTHQRVDKRVEQITQKLIDVLIVSGCVEPSSHSQSVSEALYARIVMIVKLSLDLQKALGEDITSGDVKISSIPRHEKFNPETMEDAYAGNYQAKATPDVVICTTDMGLTRKVKGSEAVVILKPKVILAAALDDMLEEAPSSND